MKKNLRTDISKILMLAAVIILMAAGYFVTRKRAYIREATSLPYYPVNFEELADGHYHGKTWTSFLRLQLDVTIENHAIKSIDVIEAKGIDGDLARPIIDEMIAANDVVVPAIKGAELGSLVYISCVSTALTQN